MSSKLYEQVVELSLNLGKLKAENEQLIERVKYLEQQNIELIKLQSQRYPPVRTDPYPTTKCFTCGLEFKGAMGYVCTRMDCPTAITCKGSI